MTTTTRQSVRAVGRGVEDDRGEVTFRRSAALDHLEVFIGRWINEGETVTTDGSPGVD